MISIYDITFYKYDEDGVEVLNEDGSTKLFRLNQNSRSSQSLISGINEIIEDTDVEEIE
jgi:hypothetical protein|tara:strand:+ start:48 stop:224 length:177 start_codon:yes stop_codon:yes gene_type:complete